jgi:type II secretory pathway component PulF
MPAFSYVARDSVTGRELRASIDASSEASAVAGLLNRNMLVVSINEKLSKKGRTGGGKLALSDLVILPGNWPR